MKERLTGAIILVALLVLLVPELLTGPGPSAPKPATAEGEPLRSYTIDLAEDAGTPRSGSAAPQSEAPMPASDASEQNAGEEVESGEAGAVAEVTRGLDSTSDPAVVDPAVSTGMDSGTSPGGQSSDVAASRPPVAEVVESTPMPRASAPVAAESPKPAAVERAKPAAPERSASAAASSASSGPAGGASRAVSGKGWMIQLGVFANRDNADRLAKQVRGKGYTVVVNETAGGGKRLYRVRVGPEPDRASATALASRLRAAGHPGSVVAPN